MSEHENDGGVFRKPLSGSFKRVGDQMTQEMEEKSPGEAMRDDFSRSSEPTDDEQANLDNAVGGERAQRAD